MKDTYFIIKNAHIYDVTAINLSDYSRYLVKITLFKHIDVKNMVIHILFGI